MNKISIISSVENGNLKRNRTLIREAIESFEGKTVDITIERHINKRSVRQNDYYWGIVMPIVKAGLKDATGELRDSKSIHYKILLPELAPTRDIVNIETGEVAVERITSSEMTTVEFNEYVKEIQRWAAHFLNVQVPDPNEDLRLELK